MRDVSSNVLIHDTLVELGAAEEVDNDDVTPGAPDCGDGRVYSYVTETCITPPSLGTGACILQRYFLFKISSSFSGCTAGVDLVVLLDGSGSVGPENFLTSKQFIVDILRQFQVSFATFVT